MPRYGYSDSSVITVEQEPPHLADLRILIEEYDQLFEKCMTRPMTNEEHKRLNGLHEALSHIEQSYWEGTPDEFLGDLQNELDSDFPFILHALGLLPTEDN